MGKSTTYQKSKIVKERTVLSDLLKRQWVVGQLLGQGGFGAIYTARELSSSEFNYVVKIEPASNGPLFTEINFYKRVCAEKEVSSWTNGKKIKFLGIPRYIGDGLQEIEDNRFLIMDRCGNDLHKLLMEKNLSHKCLFQITINMLDVLEYIHSREYSHADIKALNILQGYKSPKEVFLLDFGMVSKFMNNGVHKPEKVDNKIKHNGTLEFCPRDSHRGLISCRRSDVESLLFNLVFWLTWERNNVDISERVGCGKLPWLTYIKNVGNKPATAAILKQVAESKEKYMADPKSFIEAVGLDVHTWSSHLLTVLTSVAKLSYSEMPKYDDLRKRFAMIICEIDKRPVPSTIDLNKFRDVDWTNHSVAVNRRRQSHMSTQITPPQSPASRKRPSADIEDPAVGKPLKKQKRQPAKKLLVDNNNGAEIVAKKNQKKATKKNSNKNIFEDSSEDFVESPQVTPKKTDLSSLIPKAAWKRTGDLSAGTTINTAEASKENIIDTEPIANVKKSRKPKIVAAPASTSSASYEPPNSVIPGVKALDRLKMKVPTRSSPRIAAKTSQSNLSSNFLRSVSCQTSPGFSITC